MEKRLSQNIYERGVDNAGFGRIRSRGDQALFGGKSTQDMKKKILQGEGAIATEHVQNNLSVREMLGTRGIKPEELSPSEDIKKLKRRIKSQEKKLAKESGKLPEDGE